MSADDRIVFINILLETVVSSYRTTVIYNINNVYAAFMIAAAFLSKK